MSCKCGDNCLRKQGRRSECYSCGKARHNNSGNGAGAPRPVVIRDGRKVYLNVGSASPRAKTAGRELGYSGGRLGVFMQGAGAFKVGRDVGGRDTPHRAGWLWARDEGVHAGDTLEEAAAIVGASLGLDFEMFKAGASAFSRGVKRDWRFGDSADLPFREGYEWAERLAGDLKANELHDDYVYGH